MALHCMACSGIVKIWAFVGSADKIVNPQSSIDFVHTLNSSKAQCTIIEGATHFDVPQAYLSQEYHIVDWLLGQDQSTGIKPIPTDKENLKTEYYDLQGRRVANPSSGIYIKNKRVVLVR